MNKLFTAHIVLREIWARRPERIPFTPIQAFGLPLYDIPLRPQSVPQPGDQK